MSNDNHTPEFVGGVWCEWCEEYVTVGEYNTEHGSKVCNES